MLTGPGDPRIVTNILTKDQLAALGSVVAESTICEEFIEMFIWGLLNLNLRRAKFLTTPMQMGSRIELLAALGKERLRSPRKIQAFTDLISRLKEANNERNIVVHGSWETSKGVSLRRVLRNGPENYAPATARKYRLNSEPITASAEHIEKTALKIANLTRELMRLARAWEEDGKRQASRKKSAAEPRARSQT